MSEHHCTCATEGESNVGLVHVQQGHTELSFREPTGIDLTQWNVGTHCHRLRALIAVFRSLKLYLARKHLVSCAVLDLGSK